MANKKFSGVHVSWPKPIFTQVIKTHKNFTQKFQGALMYAHYELTSAELKKEVIKYLKQDVDKHIYLDKVKDIHENRFTTIGKYMYILNHGADVPDNIKIGLVPALEKVIDEEEKKILKIEEELQYLKEQEGCNKQVAEITKSSVTIQDRLKEKAKEVAAELEGWLDDFHLTRKTSSPKALEEFVSFYKSVELKSAHLKYIQPLFEKRHNEIKNVIEGKDKDLSESYSHYTKSEIKKLSQFYTNMLGAFNMLIETAKTERAPRKKKPVSQEKIVSKLKYRKEDSALGIVSLNPVHILGAKEVWIYNTKTRKLAHFKAADINGFSVKGTTLENFSAESAEKTLRKPAETLADFKKANKVKLRTFLNDIGTIDTPATGRFNEFHVILRIDR